MSMGWVLLLTNGQEYSGHTCWVLGVYADKSTAEERAYQINALLHKDYGSEVWAWDWDFRENVWWASFKHLLQPSVEARHDSASGVYTRGDRGWVAKRVRRKRDPFACHSNPRAKA